MSGRDKDLVLKFDGPPLAGCGCALGIGIVFVCGGVAVGWRLLVWGGVVAG